MPFDIRAATTDEIDWLKIQLDPPGYYLDKVLALKQQYTAIELDTPSKASRLKTSIKREITKRKLETISVYAREKAVLFINKDGIKEEENSA